MTSSCEHDISDSASSNSQLDRLVPEDSSRSCLLKVQPHLTVDCVNGSKASQVRQCTPNTIPVLQRCVFDREIKPDLRTKQQFKSTVQFSQRMKIGRTLKCRRLLCKECMCLCMFHLRRGHPLSTQIICFVQSLRSPHTHSLSLCRGNVLSTPH